MRRTETTKPVRGKQLGKEEKKLANKVTLIIIFCYWYVSGAKFTKRGSRHGCLLRASGRAAVC